MHYNIGRRAPGLPGKRLDAPLQNAAGGAAPAGVEQGDPPARHDQVDRDAVGDGDGEEDAGRGGDPAVDPFDLDPARGRRPGS